MSLFSQKRIHKIATVALNEIVLRFKLLTQAQKLLIIQIINSDYTVYNALGHTDYKFVFSSTGSSFTSTRTKLRG
jgi:hypothetical protein